MFDRSDALWREEPTREPAQKPARDDPPPDDLARPVNRRPGAPGHHPRDGDPEPADAHPNDPARAQRAAERRARTARPTKNTATSATDASEMMDPIRNGAESNHSSTR